MRTHTPDPSTPLRRRRWQSSAARAAVLTVAVLLVAGLANAAVANAAVASAAVANAAVASAAVASAAVASAADLPAAVAVTPVSDAPVRGEPAWSPYLVGALIGLLSMVTFYLSDKPIGVSTGYARVAGMLGKAVAPRHTESLAYYQKTGPVVDWEVMLLLGIVPGALLAAWTGGQLTGEWLPPLWTARFGPDSQTLRIAAAFGGGLLLAVGARIAGGCTSGHGISGTLQLSIGSWIAVVCFFLGGAAVAFPMFRG